MKRIILCLLMLAVAFVSVGSMTAAAAETPAVSPVGGADPDDGFVPVAGGIVKHTVVSGDTMWKLAVRHEIGLSEIIAANPQIRDPHWIYPGDVLTIPLGDADVLSMESEIVRLVNVERTSRGLGALTQNWQLSRVARYKSQDMHDRGYFAHESPTYGSPFTMMQDFGITYRTAGENIAKGYTSAAAVVEGWMNSPGHRANILNASFREIGVGYVSDGRYYTQMFIG